MNEKIKGINFKEGLARFRGNEERFLGALSKFTVAGWGEDISFDEAVLPENIADTKIKIHTVKGVAGNLAMTDVYRYCTEFEVTLKNGTPERELYDALCAAFREVKNGIQELAAKKQDDSAAKPGDLSRCIELIRELRISAETYDIGACERVIKKLRECEWAGVNSESIKRITTLAEDYEFDDAVDQIDILIAKIKK